MKSTLSIIMCVVFALASLVPGSAFAQSVPVTNGLAKPCDEHAVDQISNPIELRITKKIKDLPRKCDPELIASRIKEILPTAIVIGVREARQIKTDEDIRKIVFNANKTRFRNVEEVTLDKDTLHMLDYVARSTENEPAALIIGYDGPDPISVVVGFCMLCAQWVYKYYYLHETVPYVNEIIWWLVTMQVETLVCIICSYEETNETMVYIEPVPICDKCHNHFDWMGSYWYCNVCHVAL